MSIRVSGIKRIMFLPAFAKSSSTRCKGLALLCTAQLGPLNRSALLFLQVKSVQSDETPRLNLISRDPEVDRNHGVDIAISNLTRAT
jgi:hypothetical protein